MDVQPIEQLAPGWIGEGEEHGIGSLLRARRDVPVVRALATHSGGSPPAHLCGRHQQACLRKEGWIRFGLGFRCGSSGGSKNDRGNDSGRADNSDRENDSEQDSDGDDGKCESSGDRPRRHLTAALELADAAHTRLERGLPAYLRDVAPEGRVAAARAPVREIERAMAAAQATERTAVQEASNAAVLAGYTRNDVW